MRRVRWVVILVGAASIVIIGFYLAANAPGGPVAPSAGAVARSSGGDAARVHTSETDDAVKSSSERQHQVRLEGIVEDLRKIRPQQDDSAKVKRFLELAAQTPITEGGGIPVPLADPDAEPFPFPDDFPERLLAENVEAAIAGGIERGELQASVESTDCAAFPCMVRGMADTDADISRLKGLLEDRYPDDHVGVSTARYAGDEPMPIKFSAYIVRSEDYVQSLVPHLNRRGKTYFQSGPFTQDQLADFYIRQAEKR